MNKIDTKQSGFSLVALLIVVVAIALIGFVGWRVYEAMKPSEQNQQNEKANDGNGTKPEEPEPDPNEGYVVIKEWGVRFKPVEGLEGVRYFEPEDTSDMMAFTTDELVREDPQCSESSGKILLAGLVRSKDPSPWNGTVVATIRGYSYQTKASQDLCSSPPYELGVGNKTYELEIQTQSNLLKSLKSLEAAE